MADTQHPRNPIECKPFHGILSARACALNLQAAVRAYDMLKSGVSVFIVDHIDLDRLIGCSRCHMFPPDKPDTTELLYNATRDLARKIADWDEFGSDPELIRARARARAKRYRERHREEIQMGKRLAWLKLQHEKLGGGN